MTSATEESWFPEAWRPEPGQTIEGPIVSISAAQGGYGAYPVVTIRVTSPAGGGRDLAVHAFHDVLRHELARRGVQVGDVVAITYLGKHEEKGYYGYRVSGAERPFDWSQFDAGGAPAPAPLATPAASPPPLETEVDYVPVSPKDDIPF